VKFYIQGLLNNITLSGFKFSRLLLIVSVFMTLSLSNAVIAQSVSEIDQATSQWLNIERQANELKTDWKKQSPLLNQRVLLLNVEIKQLKQQLSVNSEGGNDVDIKRAELLTEQTRIEQQQKEMTTTLDLIRYTTNNIAPLLPPVLKSQWQNKKVIEGKNNNTQHLQSALSQLTKLTEFNQRISTHESTIEITEGKSILVQQLFLGASVAWFVTRDGQYTGWGQAGAEGWQWHVDETMQGSDIKQALAIFQKKQSADWVTLPIHITHSDAPSQTLLGNSTTELNDDTKGSL